MNNDSRESLLTEPHTNAPRAAGDDRALLVETIEQLSSARTVEEVAAVIRSTARAISGADGVTFVVRDGDQCRYVDEDAIAPLWKGKSFPLEACVPGWAMLNGKMAVIPDVFDDIRVPQDAYRLTFVNSMVMTPVRPDEPIAAIGAYWAEQREPSADELMKLELIARVTAAALENASLYASLTTALANRDTLIAELDHRVKNVLASVMSMASQTVRGAASLEAFKQAFNGRLMCMSRGHELLTGRAWGAAPIAAIVAEALEPFDGEVLAASGPEVLLSAEAATALLLVLYELGANARAYGAWSAPRGKVDLSWRIDRESEVPLFRLSWRESGGPAVTEAATRGFGARLIENGLARPPAGSARLDFARDGIAFDLSAPLSDRIKAG